MNDFIEFKCEWTEGQSVIVRSNTTEITFDEFLRLVRTFALVVGYHPDTVAERIPEEE